MIGYFGTTRDVLQLEQTDKQTPCRRDGRGWKDDVVWFGSQYAQRQNIPYLLRNEVFVWCEWSTVTSMLGELHRVRCPVLIGATGRSEAVLK